MDNYKGYDYFVKKIIEDIEFILDNTKDLSCEDFEEDIFLNNTVCFRFIQISENAKKIPNSICINYPNIPWNKISGLRNRIVHDYGNIMLDIVFNTIVEDLPKLLFELKKIV